MTLTTDCSMFKKDVRLKLKKNSLHTEVDLKRHYNYKKEVCLNKKYILKLNNA